VTSELRGVDFSQSINAANSEKNRYEDKIPCEFRREKEREKREGGERERKR